MINSTWMAMLCRGDKLKMFFRHIQLFTVQHTSNRVEEADGFRHNHLDLLPLASLAWL